MWLQLAPSARLTARHSSTDAADVALVEMLDAPLLTTDTRLAQSVTTVAVIQPA